MATTIAKASIQLTANAESLKPGFMQAEREMDKFKKATSKRLGDVAEVGEKLTSGLARTSQLGDTFARLGTDADKFGAGIDAATQSMGNLVNSMRLAKATGGSMLGGLAAGITALGAAVGFSILGGLSRPVGEDAAAREAPLGTRRSPIEMFGTGRTVRGTIRAMFGLDPDLGEATPTRGPRPPDFAELSGRASERAGTMARGFEDALAAMRGMSREELAFRAIERDLETIPEGTHEWAAATRELARARAFVRDIDIETRAAADMARGRAVAESVRTPREAAMAELRDLAFLRMRAPDALAEADLRRRADALAAGLRERDRGPTGPEALEAGSVEAARAITDAGRARDDRHADLLAEVRDAIRIEGERERARLDAIAAALAEPIRDFRDIRELIRRLLPGG